MAFCASLVVILALCLCVCFKTSYCHPPNIVFILTDDQDVEIGGMVSTAHAYRALIPASATFGEATLINQSITLHVYAFYHLILRFSITHGVVGSFFV